MSLMKVMIMCLCLACFWIGMFTAKLFSKSTHTHSLTVITETSGDNGYVDTTFTNYFYNSYEEFLKANDYKTLGVTHEPREED